MHLYHAMSENKKVIAVLITLILCVVGEAKSKFKHVFKIFFVVVIFSIGAFGEEKKGYEKIPNDGSLGDLYFEVPGIRTIIIPRGASSFWGKENRLLSLAVQLIYTYKKSKDLYDQTGMIRFNSPHLDESVSIAKVITSSASHHRINLLGVEFIPGVKLGKEAKELGAFFSLANSLSQSAAKLACPKKGMTPEEDRRRSEHNERDAVMHFIFSGLFAYRLGAPLADWFLTSREAKDKVRVTELMDLNNNTVSFNYWRRKAELPPNIFTWKDARKIQNNLVSINQKAFENLGIPFTGDEKIDLPILAKKLSEVALRFLKRGHLNFYETDPSLTCETPDKMVSTASIKSRLHNSRTGFIGPSSDESEVQIASPKGS